MSLKVPPQVLQAGNGHGVAILLNPAELPHHKLRGAIGGGPHTISRTSRYRDRFSSRSVVVRLALTRRTTKSAMRIGPTVSSLRRGTGLTKTGAQKTPRRSAQRGRRSRNRDLSQSRPSDAPGRTPQTWYLKYGLNRHGIYYFYALREIVKPLPMGFEADNYGTPPNEYARNRSTDLCHNRQSHSGGTTPPTTACARFTSRR